MSDGKMKRIKIGVIPAAGKGSRITDLPLTNILPKPMLPVLNKPILEYVIDNMRIVGIEIVYIIVGHKKEIIKDYFKAGENFGIKIKYIEQEKPRGIAHAISLTEPFINKPFMVILGDDLTITESLQNLIDDFWDRNALLVEGVVNEEDKEILKQTNYIVLGNSGNILEMVEKPKYPKTQIRGTGIYIFDYKVFDYIKKTPISPIRNEQEITHTISLIAKNNKAYGSLIKGVNVNINNLDNLIFAMNLLLKNK
jgi:dTDP-glucose pyrophosphorylase